MRNFDRQKQGKGKQIIMGGKTWLEYAAAGCQEYTPHCLHTYAAVRPK